MNANSASPSNDESDEKVKDMVSRWEEVVNTEVTHEDVIICDTEEASSDLD